MAIQPNQNELQAFPSDTASTPVTDSTLNNPAIDFEPSLENAEINWENLTEGPDTPFEDVPDADAIAVNSPVDPSAPAELLHGTDLLNGSDGDDESVDSDDILD
ncbi:hypothetical protein Q5741_12035 [Paenibacillus sp. JX-17]|uniref:Uncharacterized protein n=1 Tax=Paenibacillus lacisoli TaxID=3064525 RepID=A0ABT9CHQ2_9BACL|nr:hypothetical protein [Paenibacillus sp. JX-17]MDO7907138.1 hypothetical protein [Paenibacillus sp. JX-17]